MPGSLLPDLLGAKFCAVISWHARRESYGESFQQTNLPTLRKKERSMKIASFAANGELHLGVIDGDQVIDLNATDKSLPTDLGELLGRTNGDLSGIKDATKRTPVSARRPLAGLKFGLPVGKPGKVICLGLNYLEHVKEGSQRDNIPKFPTIFMRANTSLVPHGQPIIRPKVSETLDYEAELIIVIGKRAKHLTVDN